MLLDFFQARLQRSSGSSLRSDLPRLLTRRTLDRLAQEDATREAKRAQPRKEWVLRAALMELHRLDASTAPSPAARRH